MNEQPTNPSPPIAEGHPRHVVVVSALVRNAAGQVLLIRHHKRGWEIPQGRVEEGEGLVEALHREVHEETGVTVAIGPLVAVHSKLTPPAALVLSFLATSIGGMLTPSAESPELGWFETSAALERVVHPVNRQRLETLLDYQGQTLFVNYVTQPFRVLAQATATPSCLPTGAA